MHPPIHKLLTNPKGLTQTPHAQAPITLQQLAIRLHAHLPDIIPCVRGEEAGGEEMCLLQGGEGAEEGGIVAVVETLSEGGEERLAEEGLGYFGGFHYL